MDSFNKLEEIFSHFPGIGPRQAKRFIYYLLSKPNSFINDFVKHLEEVKKNTSECVECHRLFVHKNIKKTLCNICEDQNRDMSLLMIVSRDVDFESIEKSHVYNGYYFILGGSVPILEKDPSKRIRLNELETKLDRIFKDNSLKEIILSLNATADGEHTADFIIEFIKKLFSDLKIKITVLGRGLSTGTELEYADRDTIKSALLNRSEK